MLLDLSRYRKHEKVGMRHAEVEDHNTGLLSVVPDPAPEPSIAAAPMTEIPSQIAEKSARPVSKPLDATRMLRGLGLAIAFAGIAFLVHDYWSSSRGLTPLAAGDAGKLSSFVREASMADSKPPTLFAQVDESWELLSDGRRQEEAEKLFARAKKKWGTRDGFLHRGDAIVAQYWDYEVTIFGSLHGDE